MKTLGAALIVKDEELVIERCIRSIIPSMDEIVIADTGSKDETLDIIKRLQEEFPDKIKLYHFQWCDDFGKARNFSFSKSTTDYVGFVDSDEMFTDELNSKLIYYKENDFFGFKTIGMNICFEYGDSQGWCYRTRFIENDHKDHWKYPIHEKYCTDPKEVDISPDNCYVYHEKKKEDNNPYYRNIYYNLLNCNSIEVNHHNAMYFTWVMYYIDQKLSKYMAPFCFWIKPETSDDADYREWFADCGLYNLEEYTALLCTSIGNKKNVTLNDDKAILRCALKYYDEEKWLIAYYLLSYLTMSLNYITKEDDEKIYERLAFCALQAKLPISAMVDATNAGYKHFPENKFVKANHDYLDWLSKIRRVGVVKNVSLERLKYASNVYYLNEICSKGQVYILANNEEDKIDVQGATVVTREELKTIVDRYLPDYVFVSTPETTMKTEETWDIIDRVYKRLPMENDFGLKVCNRTDCSYLE